jgi:hypothetical protein
VPSSAELIKNGSDGRASRNLANILLRKWKKKVVKCYMLTFACCSTVLFFETKSQNYIRVQRSLQYVRSSGHDK